MSKKSPKSGPAGIKRRDFLAGALTTPLLLPALAAVARTRTDAPTDTTIARLAVYPPLGISRVGNSPEYFLAPEVPGIPAIPDGRYKDGPQKIKKQVQRFRIYAFNKAGEVIREVTAAEARIEWTVHVANTKAAWYGFNNPLDNAELAPGLPGQKRNQSISDNRERASKLVINPGSKKISGRNVNPNGNEQAFNLVGKFFERLDVKLGHLRTDDAGRLLVFPGDGVSQSAVPDNPISNFSDNDGWHDDWCDGPVQAKVAFTGGRTMEAENGWVACCGPDFAPEIPPFISLYDVMSNVNVEAGWEKPPKTPLSFTKYIYPFFQRLALMDWVAAAANLQQGWLKTVGNFGDPAYIARLANPSPDNKKLRQQVFESFRNPHSNAVQDEKLPYMLGDGINYANSPVRWFRIPKMQYAILQQWADGQFINDLDTAPGNEITRLDQVPLAEQPEALTRAALEPCSGGAFHPGVELTWPLRHKQLYRGAFRIALATDRSPDLIQDLGLLLTPEKAFGGHEGTRPAVAPQMPGDLTRWMGLPWQCDAFSCQQVVFANDFPTATWWPALLPIDVLPEAYYTAVMDPTLSPDQRVKFFQNRVMWSRGVAGIGYHASASYTDGLGRMIYLWDRMGFVVKRKGPTDAQRPKELPAVMYVEVDRGSMDLTPEPSPAFQRPLHAKPTE